MNSDYILASLPLWLSQGISILIHCYSPFCLSCVHLVNKRARIASPSRVRMIAKVISETKTHLYLGSFTIRDFLLLSPDRHLLLLSPDRHLHLLSQLLLSLSSSSYPPHISSPGHLLAFMKVLLLRYWEPWMLCNLSLEYEKFPPQLSYLFLQAGEG